jgi:hypothetical protein
MITLITPFGMLITVALLALYAAYAFWTSYTYHSWLWTSYTYHWWLHAVLGVVSLVACIGTALLRAWSQYLVYALTACFVGAWCYSVYMGAAVGFFSFFFSSPAAVAKSLAPGFALVVLSFAASWIAFRHFRRSRP